MLIRDDRSIEKTARVFLLLCLHLTWKERRKKGIVGGRVMGWNVGQVDGRISMGGRGLVERSLQVRCV